MVSNVLLASFRPIDVVLHECRPLLAPVAIFDAAEADASSALHQQQQGRPLWMQ